MTDYLVRPKTKDNEPAYEFSKVTKEQYDDFNNSQYDKKIVDSETVPSQKEDVKSTEATSEATQTTNADTTEEKSGLLGKIGSLLGGNKKDADVETPDNAEGETDTTNDVTTAQDAETATDANKENQPST